MKKNEGKFLSITGRFSHQKENILFSTHRIILKDKTKIVLLLNEYKNTGKVLIKENNGKYITVIGKVFINEILEKFDLISRTNNPYLVDIKSIELLSNE
ncbi:hypothetical protein [Aquimarina longa]|uniref:hypothetical protein n=1 Tax=Aquimarina longa TaxID=1080221 RepID=UPI0011DF0D3F|nr:hypothetical protein [Aquimarina longa]